MTITSGFADMMSSLIFLCCFVSLVSYWSKFHLNIITSSGVMTIYFYSGLTRNPEFENTGQGYDYANVCLLGYPYFKIIIR